MTSYSLIYFFIFCQNLFSNLPLPIGADGQAVGWVVGFVMGDFTYTLLGWAAGMVISMIVSILFGWGKKNKSGGCKCCCFTGCTCPAFSPRMCMPAFHYNKKGPFFYFFSLLFRSTESIECCRWSVVFIQGILCISQRPSQLTQYDFLSLTHFLAGNAFGCC